MVKEREIVSWKTLVSKEVKKLKAEGKSAKLQNVLPLVKPIWAEVKKGEHKLYRVASDEEKKLNKKVTKVVKKGKKIIDVIRMDSELIIESMHSETNGITQEVIRKEGLINM